MISYQNTTTEAFFKNNAFSIDAFNKKYAKTKDDGTLETYLEALARVCTEIASMEKTEELQSYWANRWFEEISEGWWHPSGSIMSGAGSVEKISLANCSSISGGSRSPNEEWDNLESIYRNIIFTAAKAAAYRQGLGIEFSRLRPRNAKIYNATKTSEGVVHWMTVTDQVAFAVGQKGRIPAMLFSLNISHPDILEFIQCKLDLNSIQNANISIQITDDFYEAIRQDQNWKMEFIVPKRTKGDRVYVDARSATELAHKDEIGFYFITTQDRSEEIISKEMKARDILHIIADTMLKCAEPGIQNSTLAQYLSNSDYLYDPTHEYDTRILSSNACSEQMLSRDSQCFLASLNIGMLSTDPLVYDTELAIFAPSIGRFLDDAIEYEQIHERFATYQQYLANKCLRRIGAGSTNWDEWFIRLGYEYGSPRANKASYQLQKTYNYYLYKNSIDLGAEKGNLEAFNQEKFEKAPFVASMKKQFNLDFKTMRNVTCSTIAPTGTVSLMFRKAVMSYGAEGGFGLYYWKRTRISGTYDYYFCVPAIIRRKFKEANIELPLDSDLIHDTWEGKYGLPVAKIIEENKEKVGLGAYKTAEEISIEDKLKFISGLVENCDSSISITHEFKEGTTVEDVEKWIMQSRDLGIKSFSGFPTRKMYGIVSKIPFRELASDLINEGINIQANNFSDSELDELNLSREEIKTRIFEIPERLDRLAADIHIITVNKIKYIIVVGFQNNHPYEIFGGKLNIKFIDFRFNTRKGWLTRIKSGTYQLEFEQFAIKDFGKQFEPVEQILFRLLSLNLRNGIPLQLLAEQLGKANETEGNPIWSLQAATARVIKKYIKDGEKVSGIVCPQCHKQNALAYVSGCIECTCGWQKCS